MRKLLFLSLFLILFSTSLLFALDPVAPKSERAFGFLTVDSPLPSDILEITSLKNVPNAFSITFRNNEFVKVPIGEYFLTVSMQGGRFMASEIKMLPIGTYQVTTKIQPEQIMNTGNFYTSNVAKSDVSIIANETLRLVVWK